MLNDYQVEALYDYTKDNSKMNLELFCLSVNPSFKTNPKNTKVVKELITKYEKDKSSTRLKALESFISPSRSPINISTSQNSNQNSKGSQNSNNPDKVNMNSYFNIDKEADQIRKINIYQSLFGDWNVSGTLAHSLINRENPVKTWNFVDNEMLGRNTLANKTIMQPELIIKWTSELTEHPIINFYDIHINRVMLAGNMSGYYFKLNNLQDFRVIDNHGWDAAGLAMKSWGTIEASTDMKSVFQGLESVRTRMG